MARVVWITEFYNSNNGERATELRAAIEENLGNTRLEKCFVFCERPLSTQLPPWLRNHKKAIIRATDRRFDFRCYLEFSQEKDSTYVLSNADIRLTQSADLFKYTQPGELWALSRWDEGRRPGFLDRSTQDTWAVRGGLFPKELCSACEFTLGIPGCDNAFAGRMKDAGFRVVNYALSLRTDHLHQSRLRTYSSDMKIGRPYFFPRPTKAPLCVRLIAYIGRRSYQRSIVKQKSL